MIESFVITPDHLLKSASPPDRRFIASTVRPSDPPTMKWEGGKSNDEQIKRATQWIMIAAQINARMCASNRERLYRKAKSTKKVGRGFRRVTDPKRLKYLRDGVMGKAAAYANDADDIEEITDHPILDLLARPNRLESGTFFKQQRFLDKELCGNWFSNIVGNTEALYRLAPNRTAIIPSRTTFIEGYRYGQAEEIKTIFDADEVMHFKHAPSPFSVYLGWGWVQAVILDADRYVASTRNDLSMWLNNTRPDWMLKLPEGSGEEQAKQAREQVNRRFRGPEKNREFLITTAEAAIPLQWNPRDLEGVASRQDAKEIILAAADVPLTFVELSDSNLASSKTGGGQYARQSLLPRLGRDGDDLTHMLMPRFAMEPGEYWIAYDNPVPEDEAAETDRAVKLTDAGIITINNVLSELGYDQIEPEIGDVRRYKGVPLDSLAQMGVDGMGENGNPTLKPRPGETQPPPADPSATAMAAQQIAAIADVLDEVARGDLPTATAQALLEAACPGIDPAKFTAMLSGLDSFEPASIQREADAAQAQLDAAAMKPTAPKQLPGKVGRIDVEVVADAERLAKHLEELRLKEATAHDAAYNRIDLEAAAAIQPLRQWFHNSIHELLAGLKTKTAPITKDRPRVPGEPLSFEMPQGIAVSLEAVLRPIIESAGKAGFDYGVFDLGPEAGGAQIQAALTKPVAEALRGQTERAIASVTETMEAEIRDELATGVEAGESITELTSRVRAKVEGMASHKPEDIARTETADAFMAAREQAWVASGNVWGKAWLLAPGACWACREAAKRYPKGIPLGEDFYAKGDEIKGSEGQTMKLNYKSIRGPSLHPDCRCSLISVREEPK